MEVCMDPVSDGCCGCRQAQGCGERVEAGQMRQWDS